MRKAIILLFLLLSLTSLYAGCEYLSASFSGGYTSLSHRGAFGFNSSYQVFEYANSSVALGFGVTANLDFLVNADNFALSSAVMSGPAIQIGMTPSSTLNISSGFAFYSESGILDFEDDYMGIGIGSSISYNHYVNHHKDVAFSMGIANYTSFIGLDESNREPSSYTSIFFGVALRSFYDHAELYDYYLF